MPSPEILERIKAEVPGLNLSPPAIEFLRAIDLGQTDGITCWRADSVERRSGSAIHGQGLFATEDIRPGEIIAIKPGKVINTQQVLENEDVIQGSHQQIGPDEFLAGLTPEEVDRNLVGYNHSCDPNAKVIVVREVPLAFLETKKPIQRGDEITTDYSVSFGSNTQRIFLCHCGSSRCRKFIQPGTDWLQKDFQEANRDDFPWFIRQGIMYLRLMPSDEREEFLRMVDSLRVAGRILLLVNRVLRKEEELQGRSFLVRQFKRQYGRDSTGRLVMEFLDQVKSFAGLVEPELLAAIGVDINNSRSVLSHLEELGELAAVMDRETNQTNYLMSLFHPTS